MKSQTANRTRRVTISSLALMLTLWSSAGPAGALPDEVDLVLWVWERPTAAVIDVVLADGFDTVYLHVPPGSASNRDISRFVESAHRASVDVYALAGVPRWAQEPAPLYGWLDEVVESGRFDGIVVDIEPYLLSDWKQLKRRAGLVDDFLDVVEEAQARAGILPVVVAVPFWWDQPRYQTNRDGLLVQEVLMRCDAIAVMAYRDQLVSDDGIVSLTADEIRLAGELGKQVIVTLQVAPEAVSKLTFSEEGREGLAAAVSGLAESWRIGRGFGGVAVHSYRSYLDLER